MPTIISPLITDAGLAAAIAQNGAGLQLAITHVALGTGQYTPAAGQTALTNRKEKVTIGAGIVTTTGGFSISVLFPAWAGVPNPYNATEIGFYAGDPDAGGVLFAVFSHPTSVIVQRNALDYVASFGLQLSRVPANSVIVTVDPAGPQSLALLNAHVNAADPHTQYAARAQVDAVMTAASVAPDFTTASKLLAAIKRLFGGNFTTVNFAASPFALTADHAGVVLVDATAGNVVLNLPAANVLAGLPYTFKRTDATANTVAVNRAGADTLDGAASVGLAGLGAVVAYRSDGVSKWQAVATPRGLARFTASGTFVVPPGVTTIYVSGCAGGSGGGGGGGSVGSTGNGGGGGGAGGGAGQAATREALTVTPGTAIAVTIGAGGVGGAGGSNTGATGAAGGTGGNTTFGALLTLIGATGGNAAGGNAGTNSVLGGTGGAPGGTGYPTGGHGSDGSFMGLGAGGGSSPFGGGGGGGRAGAGGGINGMASSGYGSGGGGGGGAYGSSVGIGGNGGVGSAGLLVVEW